MSGYRTLHGRSRRGPDDPELPDGAKPFGPVPRGEPPWAYEFDRERDIREFQRYGMCKVARLGTVAIKRVVHMSCTPLDFVHDGTPAALRLSRGCRATEAEILIVLRALLVQTEIRRVAVLSSSGVHTYTIRIFP